MLLTQSTGTIKSDLTVGADVVGVKGLKSNIGISFMGVTLVGDGFRLQRSDLQRLGFSVDSLPIVIRPYRSGKEMTQTSIEKWVIDLFGMAEDNIMHDYPNLYQHLNDYVRPMRAENSRESYRRNWFIFGEPRGRMRLALAKISRYIATLETSKHRLFMFLESRTLPDHSLFAVALEDALYLGVLSSKIHIVWSLAAGARLGVGNDPRWRNKALSHGATS